MSEERKSRGTPAPGPERGSTPDALAASSLGSSSPSSSLSSSPRAGERVRVKSGAFAGKSGIVSGLDAKGQVLVVLGQITVTLPPDEIELAPGEARGRSVLSSSHVKTGKASTKKAR
jgi:transcription antitermination factor NusG